MQLFFIPLLFVVGGILDLPIAHFWFSVDDGQFFSHPYALFLYSYGAWPALTAGGVASLLIVGSLFSSKVKAFRIPALYLVCTLLVGPLGIIHGVLKEHWGRPRPRQLKEFGGGANFRPCYLPQWRKEGEPMHSFASGHASMGFFFFAFVFLGRRYRSRFLERLGWGLALGLGISVSISRMAVGAHFLTDTLAAAMVMWYTASFLDILWSQGLYEGIDQTAS